MGFDLVLSVSLGRFHSEGLDIPTYYNNSGLPTLIYINFNTVEIEIVIVTRIRKVIQIFSLPRCFVSVIHSIFNFIVLLLGSLLFPSTPLTIVEIPPV